MSKQLKILFITQLYPLSENSTNSFALHYFVKEWAKKNKVQVIRPYLPYEKEKKPRYGKIEIDGVSIDIVKPLWIPVLKKAIISKKYVLNLIKEKPDVIICHLYNSYLPFAFLKEQFKVPFIIGIHRSDVLLARNYFQRLRIKKVIEKADLVVYRSLAIQNNFEKFIKTPSKNVIAYSGLPEKLIVKAKQLLNENINKETGEVKRIISVCRLIRLKQIDKVIKALKSLKDLGYKWEYTIVGEGPERLKLEKLVKAFQLENQIRFTGRRSREEVFKYMESSEIFVMPSYNETFGLVFLEAMANGCIVIGAKGWGIDGVVINRVNGILSDPFDQDELKNSLKELIEMKEENFGKIRKKSLETIIKFSNIKMAQKYINEIYKSYE